MTKILTIISDITCLIIVVFVIILFSMMPTIITIISFVILRNVIFKPNPNQDSALPEPLPFFIFRNILADLLKHASNSLIPPPIRTLTEIFGLHRSQIVLVLTKLNIADHLLKGPVNIQDLAKLVQVKNSYSLQRLLRAAESMGYFKEDIKKMEWSNTLCSMTLSEPHPNSLKPIIQHLVEDQFSIVSHMYDNIKHDEDTFPKVHGKKLYKFYEDNPDQDKMFAAAMSSIDSLDWYSQTFDYNWGQHDRIVDIGGSYGSTLARILRSYPHMTGFSHILQIKYCLTIFL